jgi:hypothetical protein
MSAPRRYRLALLAYPRSYRAARGRELLATLADGDDERGGPSPREAVALAYRGLAMRAGIAVSAEGLLVIAAAIVLLSLVGGFSWAERYLVPADGLGVMFGFWGGPESSWWGAALGVCAYVAIAAVAFGAADSRPARKRAALIAVPVAVAVFLVPGRLIDVGLSHPGTLPDFAWGMARSPFANWTTTLPICLAAAAASWIALGLVGRLSARARPPWLAATLAALTASVVAMTWNRPDFGGEYTRSAFADLQTGVFVAGLGLLVALASLARAQPTGRVRRAFARRP